MNTQTQRLGNDVGTLAEDAPALGEKVAAARNRLGTALESGKEMYGRVRDKTVEKARVMDGQVREHPYHALGIGFGLGVLIGVLVTRGCSSDRD